MALQVSYGWDRSIRCEKKICSFPRIHGDPEQSLYLSGQLSRRTSSPATFGSFTSAKVYVNQRSAVFGIPRNEHRPRCDGDVRASQTESSQRPFSFATNKNGIVDPSPRLFV